MHKYLQLFLLFLIIFIFSSSTGLSEIKNVPSQFASIQTAIDSSADGDTVLVEPGVYHERIIILNKNISLFSQFVLTNDSSYILNTVIDGDTGGTVVAISNSVTALTGFTITNGYAESGGGISTNLGSVILRDLLVINNNSQNLGGGIYCKESDVIIDRLVLANNTSLLYGGGIDFMACPSAIVSNSFILSNHSGDGGGIFTAGTSPQIQNTTFFGNSAVESGGAFSTLTPGVITLTGCLVDSNYAGVSGGGLFFNECSTVVDNLTISRNSSSTYGGGISLAFCSPVTVTNSVISDNQSNEGGGIFNANTIPQITNTNFYRNSAVSSGGALSSYIEGENSGTVGMTQCIVDNNNAGLSGGGLYFNQSSVMLDDLIVSNNVSGEYGGGVSFFASMNPSISNALITNNHSQEGGGIFNTRSAPQIQNTKLIGNSSAGSGGAFSSQNGGGDYGTISIKSCIVDSNIAGLAGGGLVFNQSPFSVTNSVIAHNNASNGGGMYVYNSGPSVLINNTILSNSANNGGAIVDSNTQNNTLIFNSILWGNLPAEIYPDNASTSIYYTDITGGWLGTGNIEVDPMVDNVTYTLSTESPCIGAGTDSLSFDDRAYFVPNSDLLGNPRPSPAGTKPDLGAIEETTITPPVTTFQLSVSILDNWNMVSIPGLLPTNQNVTSWWPGQDPQASVFSFEGGYQQATTALPGKGYWMRHIGAQNYNTGDEWPASGIQFIPHNPINAAAGWNLIGGYEDTVAVSLLTTTPAGLISGSLFRYSEGYQIADYLVPGSGYWVYLAGEGQINIPSVTTVKSVITNHPFEKFGKIVITDNLKKSSTLYTAKGEVNLNSYLMPPAPPAGVFDVRYASQRFAERLSSSPNTIIMTGVNYPVKIKAEGTMIILSDETGKEIARLKSGEEVTLSSSTSKLMVTDNSVPTEYSLGQNYPNPFNPGTNIKFSLPEDVQNVKLVIYNPLGEKVAELVNTALQAGIYNYTWNASNAASGLYIYQLVTDKFVSTKKMVLIK